MKTTPSLKFSRRIVPSRVLPKKPLRLGSTKPSGASIKKSMTSCDTSYHPTKVPITVPDIVRTTMDLPIKVFIKCKEKTDM